MLKLATNSTKLVALSNLPYTVCSHYKLERPRSKVCKNWFIIYKKDGLVWLLNLSLTLSVESIESERNKLECTFSPGTVRIPFESISGTSFLKVWYFGNKYTARTICFWSRVASKRTPLLLLDNQKKWNRRFFTYSSSVVFPFDLYENIIATISIVTSIMPIRTSDHLSIWN